MKWIVCCLLVVAGLSPVFAQGPQPHTAEGKVTVKRKRNGKIKSVKIGGVELITFNVQPNPEGRDEAEALAQINLERIAQWDGKVVKVEGLTGFSAGVMRQGRIMPSRPLTNRIQVLKITTPIELDGTVPLTVDKGRLVHPEHGSFEPAGNSNTALQNLDAASVLVKGFLFTDSQEVFVEAAKAATPGPTPAEAPVAGTPAPAKGPAQGLGGAQSKTVGLVGSMGGKKKN